MVGPGLDGNNRSHSVSKPNSARPVIGDVRFEPIELFKSPKMALPIPELSEPKRACVVLFAAEAAVHVAPLSRLILVMPFFVVTSIGRRSSLESDAMDEDASAVLMFALAGVSAETAKVASKMNAPAMRNDSSFVLTFFKLYLFFPKFSFL